MSEVREDGTMMGVVAGQLVVVLGDWQDAKHRIHYMVRFPTGEINNDILEDQISFDLKLIAKLTLPVAR